MPGLLGRLPERDWCRGGLDRSAAWVLPVLCALVAANLTAAWYRARRTKKGACLWLCLAGAVALIPLGTVLGLRGFLPIGVALTTAGALLGHGILGKWRHKTAQVIN